MSHDFLLTYRKMNSFCGVFFIEISVPTFIIIISFFFSE
jgi:hypothetical protein